MTATPQPVGDAEARIARLSVQQRAVLMAELAAVTAYSATDEGPRIQPRPPGMSAPPLSFSQRGLWFVDQLRPGDPAYNCPVALRLRGPLDVAALLAGLSAIPARHEALRTTYSVRGGEPVQIVRSDVPGHRCVDLSDLPADERATEVTRRLRDDAEAPFDLAHGPVMRTTLLRLAATEHVLLVNVHHIATDGWSMRVLYQELSELYAAHKHGRPPELAPLRVQYADFARWQRRHMDDPTMRSDLDYWSQRLADLPVLELPTDRPHPPVASSRGACVDFELAARLHGELRELGQAQGATAYMTLLAAFLVLLSRYSQQTDFAIGTSVGGRTHTELESLIGFFVNTVVLRIDLSGEPTFRELIDRVRETTVSALRHQALPFERVVEKLRPVRHPGRTPLAPVIFLVDNTPYFGPELEGLDVEPVDYELGTAKFDLLLGLRSAGDGLRGRVQFRTELFDHSTILRMVGHYRTLLEGAVDEPDRRVAELPMLTAAERRRMLVDWNDTATDFPRDACLHELFADRARSHPEATAIVESGRRTSYEDLDIGANRLAHRLRAYGVGVGSCVALALERGLGLVTGILAVLKAGAAYVPLDLGHPPARLAFMLRDTRATVVVTDERGASALPATDAPVVNLDLDRAVIEAQPAGVLDTTTRATDLAYLIYTSGSTGTPKAIALAHRGVVNNLVDLNRRFAVGPGDAVLALSSPGFDMGVYETLGMLIAGATVVVPAPDAANDPARWAELLVTQRVTLWNSAPSLLELLVAHLERTGAAQLKHLRLALLGGDWVPVSLPARVKAFSPSLELVCLGGATEVSIHSTIHTVTSVQPDWASIPYGRPMANQRAYILDDHLQPVPVSVSGELHLGGVGLARGYVNQPQLTAERFVQWHVDPPQRLFKTGDLARWREDGVIELLGRRDLMVKVNGMRVELSEVECTLRRHRSVADAAVAAGRDAVGDHRLVAYLVLKRDWELDVPALRRFLVAELPRYMVPAAFTTIDALPLNANGKVDRRALAETDPSPRCASSRPTPPRDHVEARVVSVWESVLCTERIGIDDDFFALGGDSFKAIRAVRMIDDRLPVLRLFTHSTPRALAECLRDGASQADGRVHRLTPARSSPPAITFVCVPYGGGLAAAYRPLAEQLPPRFALWSVELPGHDAAQRHERLAPIAEVAQCCAEEIVATVSGPVVLYGQCAGTALTIEVARRLERAGVEPRAVCLGASLPDRAPEESLRLARTSTDAALREHLCSLGGLDGVLDDADAEHIMRVLRHDLVEAALFFRDELRSDPQPIRCPMHVIVGSDDPATADYRERFRDWQRFSPRVRLSVLSHARHYFVKDQAAELAALLDGLNPE